MVVDTYIDAEFFSKGLAEDVKEGFAKIPKQLSPMWLYDDRGSELFEEIMGLEEYYPTRREREILITYADEIAGAADVDTLVELGSGNSEKTLHLLEAMSKAGRCDRFIPFDVSEAALKSAVAVVVREHPEIEVHGLVGDFSHHLDYISQKGRRLIAFLGGTIGNFLPEQRKAFLTEVAGIMNQGDYFLVGTDLVKDKKRLEDAYQDSKGVTAEFNLNVLNVLNRELGANFNLENFEHRAFYDEEMQWIEMSLKSLKAQKVHIKKLDMNVELREGEEILTEISAKFSPDGIGEEIATAGMQVIRQWTDSAGDYMVTLAA